MARKLSNIERLRRALGDSYRSARAAQKQMWQAQKRLREAKGIVELIANGGTGPEAVLAAVLSDIERHEKSTQAAHREWPSWRIGSLWHLLGGGDG